MLTPSLITQGEELLKKATPGPWFYDGIGYLFQGTPQNAQMVADDGDGKQTRMRGVGADLPLDKNAELICFLVNHASELLQAAREVERLRKVLGESQFDVEGRLKMICPVCKRNHESKEPECINF